MKEERVMTMNDRGIHLIGESFEGEVKLVADGFHGQLLIENCTFTCAHLCIRSFSGTIRIIASSFTSSILEILDFTSPTRILIDSCLFTRSCPIRIASHDAGKSSRVITILSSVFRETEVPVAIDLANATLGNTSVRLQGNRAKDARMLIETTLPAHLLTLEDNGEAPLPKHHFESGYAYWSPILSRFKSDPKVLKAQLSIPSSLVQAKVPFIPQDPELPTGCEVTSLAMVLASLGFPIDKCTLADKYLPRKEIGRANPWQEFIGSPFNKDAYGCYAPTIARTANAFFASCKAPYIAIARVGLPQEALYQDLSKHHPLIVWATMGMRAPHESTKWTFSDTTFRWRGNQHCLALTGYDPTGLEPEVLMMDPQKGAIHVPSTLFELRNEQYYAQSVIIVKKSAAA